MATMVDVRRTQLDFAPGSFMGSNSWIPPTRALPDGSNYQQNQLQFNLDIATNPSNMVARFRKPGPFVIEKLGGAVMRTEDTAPKVSPLKFSAVSEDRLSIAIRLAKRDVKNKMREEQQMKMVEEIEQEAVKTQKGKKKVKKGQSKTKKAPYTGRVIATRQLPIRERGEQVNSRSIKTQTPTKKHHPQRQRSDAAQHGVVLHLTPTHGGDDVGGRRSRKMRDDVRTPPSRESRLEADSPVTRQAKEIKRLRTELKEYIGKIEQLSKQASRNIPASGAKSKVEDGDGDEEEAKRKAVKKAEQASRSARLLYSLQQQVREIQEELDKLGPGQIRHTKKSRAMNRLAAAHRGAVRALQTFLHHLPEQAGADSGLPPLYQELALLIRQLSLCCAQLEIGDSGVPEGVLNILQQAKGLENALEEQIKNSPKPSSPPRPTRTTHHQASPRRRLAFGQPTSSGHHERFPLQAQQTPPQSRQTRVTFDGRRMYDDTPSKDVPVRDTDPYHTAPTSTQISSTGDRIRRNVALHMATPGTPERTAIMRAGLQALLRADANKATSQPIRNHVTTNTNHNQPIREHTTNNIGQLPTSQPIKTQNRKPVAKQRPLPSGRSLLLPAKLKADRERLHRTRATLAKDAHFTRATKSSIAKQQPIRTTHGDKAEEPGSPPSAPKPAWTPPGTPRSFHKETTPRKDAPSSDEETDEPTVRSQPKSPRSLLRSPRSKEHSSKVTFKDDKGVREGLNVEMTEREIARQAWLDSEVTRRLHELDELRKTELMEIERLRQDLTQPSRLISDAEKAVKDRLQPIINQAQELSDTHSRKTYMESQSVGRQLSQNALEKASNQGNLLSDLILEDILEDTAREMERLEQRGDVEKQAQQMQDVPTVEGLIQTLDIMEAEEEAIRRRWKKVSYTDSNTDVGLSHMLQRQENQAGGVRDDWMTGTPLEGALLERLSGDVPHQHTSITVTNLPHSNSTEALDLKPKIPHTTTNNTSTRWIQRSNQPNPNMEFTSRERYSERDTTGGGYLHRQSDVSARTLERPKYSLFVSTESRKRIDQYRERFDRHLKRKSHETIGTFDPWTMCDELADEIVDDIIEDVASQVGDIMSSCVDDLYKAEFDVTSSPSTFN